MPVFGFPGDEEFGGGCDEYGDDDDSNDGDYVEWYRWSGGGEGRWSRKSGSRFQAVLSKPHRISKRVNNQGVRD